jgi:hypothetical protein
VGVAWFRERERHAERRLRAYALQCLVEVYAATSRRSLALQTAEDVCARFDRQGDVGPELLLSQAPIRLLSIIGLAPQAHKLETARLTQEFQHLQRRNPSTLH